MEQRHSNGEEAFQNGDKRCLVFAAYSSGLTWKNPEAVNDLQSPLLQGQPVLAHHQGEHDEGHKLAGVRLRRAYKTDS